VEDDVVMYDWYCKAQAKAGCTASCMMLYLSKQAELELFMLNAPLTRYPCGLNKVSWFGAECQNALVCSCCPCRSAPWRLWIQLQAHYFKVGPGREGAQPYTSINMFRLATHRNMNLVVQLIRKTIEDN
jgi:hypothetical protein